MVFSRTQKAMLGICIVTAMFMMLGMVSPQTLGDAEWDTVTSPDGSAAVQAVDFIDETVGYAAMGTKGVMRTTDGGDSWESVLSMELIFNVTLDITDVCFIDASTGWAVGRHSYTPIILLGETAPAAPEYLSAVYFTDDAGESWNRQTVGGDPSERLNAVDFYDEDNGFAVGENGLAIGTRDGGETWVPLTSSSMPVTDINDVCMTSSRTATIVGNGGLVGQWRYPILIPLAEVSPQIPFWAYDAQTSDSIADFNAVTFTDADTGYVVMEAKNILKTTDAGDSWQSVTWFNISTEAILDISFVDANHGWAVGEYTPFMGALGRSIRYTSDGGATWDLQESGGLKGLYAIDMVNESCGFTMGEDGASYKYGATNTDRLSGDDRFDTAIEISADAFADGSSDHVVVASGANFADALAASGLAGAYECPLLLADFALSTELVNEIERVGASNVIIVGGTAWIPNQVEEDLAARFAMVTRIAGDDRYETASMIGDKVKLVMDAGEGFGQIAIIARGDNFADALAISPFAYSQKMPVLLVEPTDITDQTSGAFVDLVLREAILVGGTSSISVDVRAEIDVLLDDNSGLPSDRWSGDDRYETAAVIAQEGVDAGYGDGSYIGIATGTNFPDALGGGVACGRRGGVLLMTPPEALSSYAADFITTNKEFDTSVRIFGGENTLSPQVLTDIEALL